MEGAADKRMLTLDFLGPETGRTTRVRRKAAVRVASK